MQTTLRSCGASNKADSEAGGCGVTGVCRAVVELVAELKGVLLVPAALFLYDAAMTGDRGVNVATISGVDEMMVAA